MSLTLFDWIWLEDICENVRIIFEAATLLQCVKIQFDTSIKSMCMIMPQVWYLALHTTCEVVLHFHFHIRVTWQNDMHTTLGVVSFGIVLKFPFCTYFQLDAYHDSIYNLICFVCVPWNGINSLAHKKICIT